MIFYNGHSLWLNSFNFYPTKEQALSVAVGAFMPSYHQRCLPYASVLQLYDNRCTVQFRFYAALFFKGTPKHIDGNKNVIQWSRITPNHIFNDDVGTFVFIDEVINKYDMLRDLSSKVSKNI